jgi:glyoxylate reductase
VLVMAEPSIGAAGEHHPVRMNARSVRRGSVTGDMGKPRVVVAGTVPAAGVELLTERYSVEVADERARAALLERLPGVAAIVTPTAVAVDEELLDTAGSSLKVVANFGVGHDNIDLEAVRRRGLRATNTPDVLTDATAELAVTLMLAAARRVAEGDAMVRRGDWRGLAPDQFLGRGLIGATVGIVGFGRIGQRVARLLRGFDVRILFTNESESSYDGTAERVALVELLAQSDFVTLHVPLTSASKHLIDTVALAQMKPGAILVNASRGPIVDTAALIDALRSGRLAAAGLDVYEGEPHVPGELRELPNTVLLPHIGSATDAARGAMAKLAAANVIAVIEGLEPPSPLV